MKNFKTCSYYAFSFLLAACLFMSNFASAHADDGAVHQGVVPGGVELRLGLGYLGAGDYQSFDSGLTLNIDAGYRWDWVGFTVDFGLGGFPLDKPLLSWGDDDDYGGGFLPLCTLHVNALFSYNRDRLEVWGKLGTGVAVIVILPVLSLKAALGVSYRVTEAVGIGIDFAYMPVIGSGGIAHMISATGHLRFHF